MSSRSEAFERCRLKLAKIANLVDYDELVLLDLARTLVGMANRARCNEVHCSEKEWGAELLEMTRVLVVDVAAALDCDWPQVLETVAWQLDRREFDEVVYYGIQALPEVGSA